MMVIMDRETEYEMDDYTTRGMFALEFVPIGEWLKNGQVIDDKDVPRHVWDAAETRALEGARG